LYAEYLISSGTSGVGGSSQTTDTRRVKINTGRV
jgi:hypothetical protein